MWSKVISFLDSLDRRWVFALIAVAVIIPVYFKAVFPEKASDLVNKIYDRIEGLPEGSKLLLSFDYDPGSAPELQPMATAVARHAAEKRHKLYFIALWPVGPAMIENTVDEVIKITPTKVLEEAAAAADSDPHTLLKVARKAARSGEEALSEGERHLLDALGLVYVIARDLGKLDEAAVASGLEIAEEEVASGIRRIEDRLQKTPELAALRETVEEAVENRSHADMEYGVDYVNLGFKPGNEGVIKVIITDLKKLYTTDHYGTNIDDIEMTRAISSVQDMDLIMNISAGYPGTKEWVQYAAEPFDMPIAAGCTGVQAPLLYPYIPEPLFGLMGAIKGAAEYEAALRIGYPKFDKNRLNKGVETMGPQMIAHLAILLLIVIGNITFFATRKGRRAQGER